MDAGESERDEIVHCRRQLRRRCLSCKSALFTEMCILVSFLTREEFIHAIAVNLYPRNVQLRVSSREVRHAICRHHVPRFARTLSLDARLQSFPPTILFANEFRRLPPARFAG